MLRKTTPTPLVMSRPLATNSMIRICPFLCSLAVFWTTGFADLIARGDEPLHVQIDRLVEAKAAATGAEIVDDAGFMRRIYLDLAGTIPSADDVRKFLADQTADKRQRLIEELLNGPLYARAMRERFHILLMERRGDDDGWKKYLEDSFAANKPFDQLVREILNPNPDDEATRAAAFFMTKRLESYGQNPTDFPGLTRDVARLFLGQDLQCAQCHNHLFVDQYKQIDFQGLYIVFLNLQIRTDVKFPAVKQNPLKQKLEFVSVFDSTPRTVGPRLPGGSELPVTYEPEATNTKPETETPAEPDEINKKTGLALFAETIPTANNLMFTRNAANRVWFLMMGRGLVHPLDLHHEANPPSHPELLDLLAREFAAHQFDLKWLLRELALSATYQRASLIEDAQQIPAADSFLVFNERRLSAEQLMWSVLQATGELERVKLATEAATAEQTKDANHTQAAASDNKDAVPTLKDLQKAFVDSFANEPREPEEAVEPSVKGALFWRNDQRLLCLLEQRSGNLIDRLAAIGDDQSVADELYLSVLSRLPSETERSELAELLKSQPENRAKMLGTVAWALLASVEFFVNH